VKMAILEGYMFILWCTVDIFKCEHSVNAYGMCPIVTTNHTYHQTSKILWVYINTQACLYIYIFM